MRETGVGDAVKDTAREKSTYMGGSSGEQKRKGLESKYLKVQNPEVGNSFEILNLKIENSFKR